MNTKQITQVIKLFQRQIDDLQFEKSLVLKNIDELNKNYDKLELEKHHEIGFIKENNNRVIEYEKFFYNVQIRQDVIKQNVSNLQQEIAKLEEEIISLFKEKKKYEILLEQLYKKDMEAQKKVELKTIDEFNQRSAYSDTTPQN